MNSITCISYCKDHEVRLWEVPASLVLLIGLLVANWDGNWPHQGEQAQTVLDPIKSFVYLWSSKNYDCFWHAWLCTVNHKSVLFLKKNVHGAFSIVSFLAPLSGTSCQTQRFKLARSCPLSWDLQRQMLSAYARVARPQQGLALQLCQSREVFKTPQRTKGLVFIQIAGFAVSSMT